MKNVEFFYERRQGWKDCKKKLHAQFRQFNFLKSWKIKKNVTMEWQSFLKNMEWINM